MEIKTKFNIGQEVFVITPYINDWGGTTREINIVEKAEIEEIEINKTDAKQIIMYWLRNRWKEHEEFIFATKTEAEIKLKERENGQNIL